MSLHLWRAFATSFQGNACFLREVSLARSRIGGERSEVSQFLAATHFLGCDLKGAWFNIGGVFLQQSLHFFVAFSQQVVGRQCNGPLGYWLRPLGHDRLPCRRILSGCNGRSNCLGKLAKRNCLKTLGAYFGEFEDSPIRFINGYWLSPFQLLFAQGYCRESASP